MANTVSQADHDALKAQLEAQTAEFDVAKTAVASLTTTVSLLADKLDATEFEKPTRLVDPGAIWHEGSWAAWAAADQGAALTAIITDTLTGCANKAILLEMFVDVILPLLLDATAAALPSLAKVLRSFRDKLFLAQASRDLPKDKVSTLRFHLSSSRIPKDLRTALRACGKGKEE